MTSVGESFAAPILCCLLLAACSREAPPRRPNVVFVVLDTLRPDHLGCYGYERDTSPHLDAMASECFLFENAQSCAPWTAPALISLMSSLYPDAHGVTSFPDPGRLSESAQTLAEVLHDRGYATAAITDGGYARGQFGLDQGFDLYLDERGSGSPSSFDGTNRRLAANIDDAIEWIGEQKEQPFLLFLHTFEVHSPRVTPPEFRPDFDKEEYRRGVIAAISAWNETRELDADGARLLQLETVAGEFVGMPFPEDVKLLHERTQELGHPILKQDAADDPELVDWVRDLYDAEIRYTDLQLERLWEALESQGVWDDTVVVLVSDHGEGLGDHGRIGHGALLHEELLRILLMIRVPESELAPRRVTELARSVDVMPTVLELVGARTTGLGLQGESLVPVMRGEGAPRAAYSHALNSNGGQDVQHTIREGDWRLIVDSDNERMELYDLSSDPKELVDLAEREPERVRQLLEKLELQRRVDAAVRSQLGGAGIGEGLDPAVRAELSNLGYVGDEPESED